MRWMLFVDGENFTLRAQKFAESNGLTLNNGAFYYEGIFVWMPSLRPGSSIYFDMTPPFAIRSYYYTSVSGDELSVLEVKQALRRLEFQAEVFKKKKGEKAKGVDITLTKDVLSHAFRNNYDAAVLIAGDGDYVPLVEEVKRLGKIVVVAFFEKEGLNENLRLASDIFVALDHEFTTRWTIPKYQQKT